MFDFNGPCSEPFNPSITDCPLNVKQFPYFQCHDFFQCFSSNLHEIIDLFAILKRIKIDYVLLCFVESSNVKPMVLLISLVFLFKKFLNSFCFQENEGNQTLLVLNVKGNVYT